MTEEVTSVVVYMRHLRQSRLCARGARAWWLSHGLNWNDFLENGISSDVLEATGDPMVIRPIMAARIENGIG